MGSGKSKAKGAPRRNLFSSMRFARRSRKEGDMTKAERKAAAERDATELALAFENTRGPQPLKDIKKLYSVDWSKKGELGSGHYATVFKGKYKDTGDAVAMKRIKRSLTRMESLQTEISALRKVGEHPNIVALYDVYFDHEYVVLVLEMLAGGELFDRIVQNGAYSERNASAHICKITRALSYMHAKGIVHRDLKPENLVLKDETDKSEIKISDFGLSKMLKSDEETMQTVCGTRAYSAPEVNFGGKSRRTRYTNKVDIWSVGVILYVIMAAYHPFDPYGDATDKDIWDRIVRGEWDFDDPVWHECSAPCKDLIKHMICRDPEDRYDAAQVLRHPWIAQVKTMPSAPLQSLTLMGGRSLKTFTKRSESDDDECSEVDALGTDKLDFVVNEVDDIAVNSSDLQLA